jgi:hypothetical protein
VTTRDWEDAETTLRPALEPPVPRSGVGSDSTPISGNQAAAKMVQWGGVDCCWPSDVHEERLGITTPRDSYPALVTYPLVRNIWCSDHWRPPESVEMTSSQCCDDVWWRLY